MKSSSIFNKTSYGNIFLTDNRQFWKNCPYQYNRDKDLVLSYDFAVIKEMQEENGEARYIDYLEAPEILEKHNSGIYHFFNHWYKGGDNKDFFQYKGIDFGNSFRLEYWNDVTYFVRIFLSLKKIQTLKYENIYVGTDDKYVIRVLKLLGLKYKTWDINAGPGRVTEYYFPVFRWMDERIRPQDWKTHLRNIFSTGIDILYAFFESIGIMKKRDFEVFVQDYFPTRKIIESLEQDNRIGLVLERYWFKKKLSGQRKVPEFGFSFFYKKTAEKLLENARKNKTEKWIIDGTDISDLIYKIILDRVEDCLPQYMKTLDNIIHYFSKRNLKLMISVTSIGMLNSLLNNYCLHHGITTYCIINGILISKYMDEAINTTWINSYGPSIRDNYFKGFKNIVTLGDPRMDIYRSRNSHKTINHQHPVILIGAGGFSNIDLISYIAFEFDFINDVLQALKSLQKEGREMDIIIKVRSNGYAFQYQSFIEEYFPQMKIRIEHAIPFRELLNTADLSISIYSSTLLEASTLKIPVIYYKKDDSYFYPPYDGKSELVTALNLNELIEKIRSFYNDGPIFQNLMKKEILEKYIGPLDGNNLKLNLEFIYSLLGIEYNQENCL